MKFVILLLLSLILLSCTKTYNSKKVIQNTSSQTIRALRYNKIYNRFSDSTIIGPKSEAIIEQFAPSHTDPAYTTVGGCANPPMVSISLEVYNKPSLKITKDITNSDNWTFNKTSNQREVNVECRAIITDADIVPK